jgi:hypothetical protein
MVKLQDGKISKPQDVREERRRRETLFKERESSAISIEDIADITQEAPAITTEQTQTITEPFELTPITQDRPVLY